jgi:alpha-amylase/alpha-mannosidase (GH57 family)
MVDLLFLWHHHQPDYRSPRENRALLPWVALHATKDYLDMALHLERHARVRATFNFVPSLLDQLDDVVAGRPEELFELLARPVEGLSPSQRALVIVRCSSAPRHAFERWPRYRALVQRLARRNGNSHEALLGEILALECWFLLAWLDPMLHDEPEAAVAIATGGEFSEEHRAALLDLFRRIAARVVPTYRALAESGQIELSESAYYHPILPLLVDARTARRARPEMSLPQETFAAPEDAEQQIRRAFARHERAFGSPPAGMWPPEGSVSPEVAELATRAGAKWLATDEGVLWQSLHAAERHRPNLYQPWRYRGSEGAIALFFRDRELSDRIGFVYHHWDTAEAVADFIGRVRRIGREQAPPGRRAVVPVILDGENCWENYPADGGPFLEALYTALEQAEDIRTVTPSQVLADAPPTAELPALHSGSWIDSDYHIWIGHPEKNRGWELLARARRALVEAHKTPAEFPEAWESLYAAEGSDWFWWFGEDHYTADKGIFDRIFREHLQAVYARAGLPAPSWLQVAVSRFTRRPDLATQPLGFVKPRIDGRPTHFYEWYAAGRHRLGAGGGSMHRDAGIGRDLYFGYDAANLYVRLDFATSIPPGPEFDLLLDFLAPKVVRVLIRGLEPGERPVVRRAEDGVFVEVAGAECRIATVLELALPFERLGLAAGDSVDLLVQLMQDGVPVESLPAADLVRFSVPDASYGASMWSA